MARGSEDGVDRIAYGSGEVVSFQVTVFLHMPDDRLDHCRQLNAQHSTRGT